jgi:hypothetical protein
MLDRVHDLPFESLAALTAVVFVGAYWVGCIFLRPFLRIFVRSTGDENSVVGVVLSAFGVLYGLLLSLIAVAAYQNLSQVDAHVSAEASTLWALYQDVGEFPAPDRERLRTQLREYCQYVIAEEWPVQRRGEVPLGAGDRIAAIRKGILDFETRSRRDELVQAEALKHFGALTEHGRNRRYAAQASIPTVMWYVVITGTLINFVLMWLYKMRFITQLFLGGLLAFFLGTLILLIAVLERPYRSGEFGVSPQAHQLALQMMTRDVGAAVTDPGGK